MRLHTYNELMPTLRTLLSSSPFQKLLNRYQHNDFVRNNLTFFIGSTAVSVVNYLYYPVLGHLLRTEQFGEVQALVSLFLQLALLLNVAANVTVNVVANAKNDKQRNQTVFEIGRLATFSMAGLLLLTLPFINQIKSFLNFTDSWPFVILGVSLVISASLTLRSGYLRGVNAYGQLSIANLLGAAVKLLASAGLVAAGLGTNGAIGGLVVAQLLSYFYVRSASKKAGLRSAHGNSWLALPDMKLIKPELSYSTAGYMNYGSCVSLWPSDESGYERLGK